MAPSRHHPEQRRSAAFVVAAYAATLLCGIARPAPASSFCPSPHHYRAAPSIAAAPTPQSTTALFFRESVEEDLIGGNAAFRSALGWTTWDVALNIGREEGTWMPESWGASGTRLILKAQVQFRPYSLYHRLSALSDDFDNDFLDGPTEEARDCHVVGGLMTLGPSATESGKRIVANSGGWRIARGEGPMGSDELRFFIELGQRVERGDVSCPAGRIYCTCGYFDVSQRGRNRKADAQQTLDSLGNRYNDLLSQLNEEGPLSLNRMNLWADMLKCQADIGKANRELDDLHWEEPDLSLLSLSQEGGIGLTKGGVSCKVQKGPFGLGTDYHSLGKMELKSSKNERKLQMKHKR